MNFLIVLITFLLMEGITWLTHKYIMHGFLWSLHKDHHDHSRKGKLERNDYFFIIFAVPAIAMMYYGSTQGFNHLFYIGLGITIYGFAYFFVHDIFIHQRIGFLKTPKIHICWESEGHTNNIISIREKKKENVSDFYGFQLSILKCISENNGKIYLPLNQLFTIIICFVFSFHPKIRFDRYFIPFLKASVLVAIPFILWDAWFTKIGVWWFNDRYLLGIRFWELPLEELLFFICIPFSCVFTYFCLTKFFNLKWNQNIEKYFTLISIVILLVLALLNSDKIYTWITFLLTAISMFYLKFIAKSDWIGKISFVYTILMLGFFPVNGVLTGTGIEEAVVNYNPDHFLGIRMLTIPVEDTVYGYMMIIWNIYFFEKFKNE